MQEHEQFQELCAAASIGQLSPEQLASLENHMADCADCRNTYADYSHIAGLEYSLREHDTTLNSTEANRYLNSTLLRSRFFARAEVEGIVFSEQVDRTVAESKLLSFPLLGSSRFPTLIGAAAAVLVVVSASLISYRIGGSGGAESVPVVIQHPAVITDTIGQAKDQLLHDSLARQAQLESQVAVLQVQLKRATEQTVKAEAMLEVHTGNHDQLVAERDSQRRSLGDLQQKLNQAEAALKAAQRSATEAQAKADGSQATFVADQVQIRELSDQLSEKGSELDREREMLQAGREVRDLMAARNLHIVDVFDTDPKGKTKPTFGRIFFTEGKSLLFYAYDLNETKIEKGSQYRIWGVKEGQEKQAKSLGIFFSDDRTQKRWVFKYSDPRILDEIDSVFVTLEPPGDDSLRPRGQKLMDAYLRAQPNHP